MNNDINYDGEELEEYRKYFGRVVLKYHKTTQTQVRMYGSICDDLELLEVLPTVFDGDEFPGYDKVRLSYKQLHSIISRKRKVGLRL